MKPHILSFIPGVIWTIMIFILLIMPGSDIPSNDFFELIYFDKWVHIGLFGGLTFLTAYPFIKAGRLTKELLIKIGISFIMYGILIEFIQKYFASDRSFDITDMIADAVGCLAGCIASNWVMRKLAKKNKPL